MTDEAVAAKLEHLRVVMEKHPGSLWAKRAGLVSGVILKERDSARAVLYFRSAMKDFPVLEDYVRLWTGQALMNSGDTAEAAALLQSIAEVVPDSVMASRATYDAAESWYRAGQCDRAVEQFSMALRSEDKESVLPLGYLHQAECQTHMNDRVGAQATLRRLWVKYPNTPEAQEADARLAGGTSEGWTPSADERYERARVLQGMALHAEAVDEFRYFLATANGDARIGEAKFRMGLSLARLKQYDRARKVFQDVLSNHQGQASEAVVWLARVYLRQSEGDALLSLTKNPPKVALTKEQRAMLHILRGVWLEDQEQVEAAVTAYRQASELGSESHHRSEALWKIGWAWYRAGQWKEAMAAFQRLADDKESDSLVPQALYWMARTSERLRDPETAALYEKVCQSYPVTYYCQLARDRRPQLPSVPVTVSTETLAPGSDPLSMDRREEITRDADYRRAVELRILGMDTEAARELTALTRRYDRDPAVVLALSRLLNETGAYGPALRLARLHFRDDLERRGTLASPALWTVAYPTVFVPTARAQGAKGVDPYLVAAVIREESQYDGQAVSRVGAIGLMQVMPATAATVAKRIGLTEVTRDDLFDEGTNVRIGVRYLEQLLDQFQGNEIYAVASYNAGPRAVTSWVARNGHRDADEFVELIPYQETRLYVKRVLRSYREYLRLRNGAGGT
ncbi:murein transglycosylase [Nitrospira sp.]|nr:murein transglycosylase [Nitrospira sp.]